MAPTFAWIVNFGRPALSPDHSAAGAAAAAADRVRLQRLLPLHGKVVLRPHAHIQVRLVAYWYTNMQCSATPYLSMICSLFERR